MSETTSTSAASTTATTGTTTTATTAAAAPATPQNYILYRTADLMFQPGYTYVLGETPQPPTAVVSSPKGTVIITQTLSSPDGLTTPDGTAYALDADGKYPVGSIYTPPAPAA